MDAWRELLVIFIFFCIGLWAWTAKGQEQVPCIDKLTGVMNLAKAGEKPAFVGLSARGHITTIFVNKQTGAWTATYTTTTGHLCVADAGQFGKLVNTNEEVAYE